MCGTSLIFWTGIRLLTQAGAQRFQLVPKLTALAKNQFQNETKTSVNESPLTRELFAGTMVTVYTLYSLSLGASGVTALVRKVIVYRV